MPEAIDGRKARASPGSISLLLCRSEIRIIQDEQEGF
jgi:hypothetical protein